MTNRFATLPYDILDMLVVEYLQGYDRDNFVSSFSTVWYRRNQLYRRLYHQEISKVILPLEQYYYMRFRAVFNGIAKTNMIMKYVTLRGYEILFRRYWNDQMCKRFILKDIGQSGHLHIMELYAQLVPLRDGDYDCILESAVKRGHLTLIRTMLSRGHPITRDLINIAIGWEQENVLKFCLINFKEKLSIRDLMIFAIINHSLGAVQILDAHHSTLSEPELDYDYILGQTVIYHNLELSDYMVTRAKTLVFTLERVISAGFLESLRHYLYVKGNPDLETLRECLEKANRTTHTHIQNYLLNEIDTYGRGA